MRVKHGFEPVYDENSRVLVLGTMPSVKSREQGFYYGHPQNRFWKVIAGVLDVPVPQTTEEKKEMLLAGRIAVWDVLTACDIEGSDDSSIRNPEPADLARVFNSAHGLQKVICNGDKAYKLYMKFFGSAQSAFDSGVGGLPVAKLPSTSPANAAWSLERLTAAWREELAPLLLLAECIKKGASHL